MWPLITAALGLIQDNKKAQEQRKQAMTDAAMGKFAQTQAPGGGGNVLGKVAGALGGGGGGDSGEALKGIGGLSLGTEKQLDDTFGAPGAVTDEDLLGDI